jgi:hypothetical protein
MTPEGSVIALRMTPKGSVIALRTTPNGSVILRERSDRRISLME